MPTITINGQKIEADNNKTLLEVIRENNIADVPTLCHSKLLEPFASCSLCVAEVEGAPNLKRTCATPIVDGMVVETDSKPVHRSRKTNLELLISNHKADCYAPCTLACPAGVDVQGYIALVRQELYTEAIKLIKETNPLPMVCGKVCAKPCEDVCRRNFIDSPVDIKNIKRFAAKKDLETGSYYSPAAEPSTGKKIAVIGSGPAGLSAAYFLRLKGHSVKIFEIMPKAGGMMRYGIPEYRLPKADLQAEIDSILNLGVEIEFNKKFGDDFTLESLKTDGYDSIFIGIGAQLGSNVRTPGGNLDGIIQGVDFLRDVNNSGIAEKLSGKVFVVGGGNTAIDAARTALRYGAETVSIIYRRTEAEMPAAIEEIDDAKEENISINILTNPVEYIGENGRLSKVKLVKMELGEPDSSGRRRPVVMEGSEYDVAVDYVIEAIGQRVDTSSLGDMALTRWNSIDADENIMTTNIEGVFAGGDAVTGPSIIISAVAQGRKAAYSIEQYLEGKTIEAEDNFGFKISKEDFGKLSEKDFSEHPKSERYEIGKAKISSRVNSFEEVELGFNEEDAKTESDRCLECGCQDIFTCRLKKYSKEYSIEKENYIIHPSKTTMFNDVAPLYPTETDNPFIIRNFAKCVLCGKCVQACKDVQVNDAIDFGYRGVESKIVAAGDNHLKDSDCVFCGECVQVCPTGALTEKNVIYRGKPWEDKTVKTTCSYCGVGCQLDLHVKANKVVRITGNEKSGSNDGSLCVKGRYAFDFIGSDERLTTPLIKENGEFKEASWDEALNLVAEKFTSIKEKNGSDSIGVLASARMSNEENYLVQKFTRAVLKTNNVDHCARL